MFYRQNKVVKQFLRWFHKFQSPCTFYTSSVVSRVVGSCASGFSFVSRRIEDAIATCKINMTTNIHVPVIYTVNDWIDCFVDKCSKKGNFIERLTMMYTLCAGGNSPNAQDKCRRPADNKSHHDQTGCFCDSPSASSKSYSCGRPLCWCYNTRLTSKCYLNDVVITPTDDTERK